MADKLKVVFCAMAACCLWLAIASGEAVIGKVSEKALRDSSTRFVEALAKGDYQAAASGFDATMKRAMPVNALAATWGKILKQVGPCKQFGEARIEHPDGPYTYVFVPCTFANAVLDLKIVYSQSGVVSGFFIVSHRGSYKEAPYAKPALFEEKDVKVGKGTWVLDGTLTIPKGQGPYPAVVLVHGSGAHDRDETIGPNKPFRDIAHGLASRRVAVLRYEKRTRQHQGRFKKGSEDFKTLTVKQEAVDDALEAVRLLQSEENIDGKRVFVLGHSLGGMVVPRMAIEADRSGLNVCGFISMAGSNIDIADKMVEQLRYIISLGGPGSAVVRQKMEKVIAEVKKVKALKEGDSAEDRVILNAGAAYWLDLRAHDPLEELKKVRQPVLFLQGGRDYQVTADGDFANWKKAARKVEGGAERFQFKLYPKLNHLFFCGSGKITPGEYERSGHVSEEVLADISNWIEKH